jgi:ABC-type multidrug transport system fused ATPase/permease subunit
MKTYIRKIKRVLLIQILFSALYILTIAFIPYINKLLFDYNFNNGINGIILLGVAFSSLIILGALFRYISQKYEWKKDKELSILMKHDFFKSIIKKDYSKFAQTNIGDYISMINNDITVIESRYVDAIIDIIKASITLIIYAIFLFVFIDYRITVVIIIATGITIIVPKMTIKALSNKKKAHLRSFSKYTEKLKDLFEGAKFVNKKTEKSILDEHNKYLASSEEKKYGFGKFNAITDVLNRFALDFLNLSAISAIAYLLYKKEITLGTGVATLGYIDSFIYPVRYILKDVKNINVTKEIKSKVISIINEDKKDLYTKAQFNSHIEFKDITIEEEGFLLLNFSYEFKKGKKYAIIGPSGSGKSTIVSTLMKYAKVQNGEILIDGENIEELDTSEIITCINQNEYVYADNFSNNVSIFNTYVHEYADSIVKYLRINLEDIFTDKSNCQVLNEGEKQLIALIRMLIIDNEILVFDDPFSAIDFRNTQMIEERVFGLSNKTVIFASHNISEEYLKDFDELIIMEKGKILISGEYRKVIESQEYKRVVYLN